MQQTFSTIKAIKFTYDKKIHTYVVTSKELPYDSNDIPDLIEQGYWIYNHSPVRLIKFINSPDCVLKPNTKRFIVSYLENLMAAKK